MSFASDLFSGLAGFRDHLAEVGSELVHAVEADLAKLAPVIATNVLHAEEVAKGILHDLYNAATAGAPAAPVPANAQAPGDLSASQPVPPAEPAPEPPVVAEPAPVPAPEPVPAAPVESAPVVESAPAEPPTATA